jgi:hypothetical protein
VLTTSIRNYDDTRYNGNDLSCGRWKGPYLLWFLCLFDVLPAISSPLKKKEEVMGLQPVWNPCKPNKKKNHMI